MASQNFDLDTLKSMILQIRPQVAHKPIDEKTPLFQEGILDSYAIIQLVNAIEEKFGLTFNFRDVKAVNFETLGALISYLNLKYGGNTPT